MNAIAPRCPHCGQQMYLRISTQPHLDEHVCPDCGYRCWVDEPPLVAGGDRRVLAAAVLLIAIGLVGIVVMLRLSGVL